MTMENEKTGRENVKSFDLRLREASKTGDLATIQKICAVRNLVNVPDVIGRTALHYGAKKSTDAVAALIAADFYSRSNITPIHKISRSDFVRCHRQNSFGGGVEDGVEFVSDDAIFGQWRWELAVFLVAGAQFGNV